MRFIIDENVRKEVMCFLLSCNFDIIPVPSGATDEQVAKLAEKTKRIILTHDKHFANITMYPPKKYSGIIRIKIHPPTASVIIDALTNLFKNSPAIEFAGKLIILEEDGFRIR